MTLYGRFFALVYDPFLAWGERAGMRALRREALTAVGGRVIEIGAGSGLNVGLYPAGIDGITFTEPEAAMRRRLGRRVADLEGLHEVVAAPADRLPAGSATVDTVVSTLVLCTVADLPATLTEIRRVLVPGGRLVLVEHVRATRPRSRAWQDRLHRPWKAFAEGCHCNRDTVAALRAAGFDTSGLRPARWKRMPPIVAPLVYGTATV